MLLIFILRTQLAEPIGESPAGQDQPSEGKGAEQYPCHCGAKEVGQPVCDMGAAFAAGALEALVWAKGKAPGIYTMQDVLGLS